MFKPYSIALIFCALAFNSFSQVQVTYGGLNSPELPALGGSEYLAKVNDHMFFTGSATSNSITLLSYDPQITSKPINLVRNWVGTVDGQDMGKVHDLHYDAVSSKLYVVQSEPSQLSIFNFHLNDHSLGLAENVELTGMLSPERICITENLAIVADMTNGQLGEVVNIGSTVAYMGLLHDVEECGVAGNYTDLELAPNGDYLYVTSFGNSAMIKFGVTQNGIVCQGSIDMASIDLPGNTADLTFINDTEAFVTTCAGMSGMITIDLNGDFIDVEPIYPGMFDPMKSIFIPSESILVIQDAMSIGSSFVVESNNTLTEIGEIQGMVTANKELLVMAGNTIVYNDHTIGGISALNAPAGVLQLSSTTYSAGTSVVGVGIGKNVDINPSGNRMITGSTHGRAGVYSFGEHGEPKFHSNLLWDGGSDLLINYLDDEHILCTSVNGSFSSIRSINEINGTADLVSISNDFNFLGNGQVKRIVHQGPGNPALALSTIGGSLFSFMINSDLSITDFHSIEIPWPTGFSGVLGSTASADGNLVVVSQVIGGEIHVFELESTNQDWQVTNSFDLGSTGSTTSEAIDIAFLNTENLIAVAYENNVKVFDRAAGYSLVDQYVFEEYPGAHVMNLTYNSRFNQLCLAHRFSFDDMATFLSWDEQTSTISGITNGFIESNGDISAFDVYGYPVVAHQGQVMYYPSWGSDVIHTFGFSDETTIGIEEETQVDVFKVYPNPVSRDLTISFEENFTGTLTLVDNTGRVVLSESVNAARFVIDLSDQPTGLYHVRTLSNDGVLNTMSVVKN